MKDRCLYCGTTYDEIVENGFVGCDKCYSEIEPLKKAIDSMYKGKRHKGRGVRRKNGEF